jgi:hypothetical protein
MEVHAHSHTARKKWTHYFWEFFMLFLAVTLGFFVENQREHYIEKLRAKEFARSLIADLAADTAFLNNTISIYDTLSGNIDSFLRVAASPDLKTTPGGTIYYYGDAANSGFRMAFNTATLEQLKSSGSLRYFPAAIKKKIADYDQAVQWYNLRQGNEPLLNIETSKYLVKIFDNRILAKLYSIHSPDSLLKFRQTDYKLLNDDPVLLKEYANICFIRQGNWRSRIQTSLMPLKQMAAELATALKEKYNLK